MGLLLSPTGFIRTLLLHVLDECAFAMLQMVIRLRLCLPFDSRSWGWILTGVLLQSPSFSCNSLQQVDASGKLAIFSSFKWRGCWKIWRTADSIYLLLSLTSGFHGSPLLSFLDFWVAAYEAPAGGGLRSSRKLFIAILAFSVARQSLRAKGKLRKSTSLHFLTVKKGSKV